MINDGCTLDDGCTRCERMSRMMVIDKPYLGLEEKTIE